MKSDPLNGDLNSSLETVKQKRKEIINISDKIINYIGIIIITFILELLVSLFPEKNQHKFLVGKIIFLLIIIIVSIFCFLYLQINIKSVMIGISNTKIQIDGLYRKVQCMGIINLILIPLGFLFCFELGIETKINYFSRNLMIFQALNSFQECFLKNKRKGNIIYFIILLFFYLLMNFNTKVEDEIIVQVFSTVLILYSNSVHSLNPSDGLLLDFIQKLKEKYIVILKFIRNSSDIMYFQSINNQSFVFENEASKKAQFQPKT